jgi:hypothetical protein
MLSRGGSPLNVINFTLSSIGNVPFFEDKRAWVDPNVSLPFGNHQLDHPLRPTKRRCVAPEVLGM